MPADNIHLQEHTANALFSLGEIIGNHLRALTIRSTGGLMSLISLRLNHMALRIFLNTKGQFRPLAAVGVSPLIGISVLIAFASNILFIKPKINKLTKHYLGVAIQVKLYGSYSSA
jgi:hypothetical protein